MKLWKLATLIVPISVLTLFMLILILTQKNWYETDSKTPNLTVDVDVPNIVHFIRFGNRSFTFIEAVCMFAALKNQKPTKVYVHTDRMKFQWGKYWEIVVRSPLAKRIVEVKYLPLPRTIMGKRISEEYLYYHAGDYERINLLMKYGGIYLDNDCYIVKNLSEFFRYEMTFGWNGVGDVFSQVLIAKNASKFLRLWHASFVAYRPRLWFYNGGYLPSKLVRMVPEWVHVVPHFLAEYSKHVNRMLFYWDTGAWKHHYAVHLLVRHQYMLNKSMMARAGVTYPVEFNETNILDYPINIRQMALDVYPYDQSILDRFSDIYPHLPGVKDDKLKSAYEELTESYPTWIYFNRTIEKIRNNSYDEKINLDKEQSIAREDKQEMNVDSYDFLYNSMYL